MSRHPFEADLVRPPHPSVARFTLWLASRLQNRLREAVEAELRDVGPGWPAFLVVQLLAELPGLAQDTVAERTGLDRTHTSTLLRDLEADGLVVRRIDATDRRRVRSSATESGAALAAEGARAVDAATRRSLHRLSARERARLDQLLQRGLGYGEESLFGFVRP